LTQVIDSEDIARFSHLWYFSFYFFLMKPNW